MAMIGYLQGKLRTLLAAGAMAVLCSVATAAEQFIPVLDFWTGPLAPLGSGVGSGFIDYMDLLNKRDGGVNGVKLTWEECETGYQVDRGVECYERLKRKGAPAGPALMNPLHTGTSYALAERAVTDKLPLITIGYGRSDATDGRVFPYMFPLVVNYLSGNTAKIKFIGIREGGMDKLKGKKIVHLYHDSPYGKEVMPVLDAQAKKYGFELVHVGVTPPGTDQQAQWLQVRQLRPDWVILRGAGVMNPTALRTAQRVGFPVDHIVGNWWVGSEEDMTPAGDAAKGFFAANFAPPGAEFPVIREIQRTLYSGGKKGRIDDTRRIGTVFYNAGVIHGIVNTEAIRAAQAKYGKKPLTGEQVRWGLENLNIDEKRLKALGAVGFLQPIKTSCMNHEGGGAVKFFQWDGHKWIGVSDFIAGDQSLTRPLIEESAAKYAKEKNIKLRDCSKES